MAVCERSSINGTFLPKHGVSDHPLYPVWNQMRQRCFNPKSHKWRHYGKRGIVVCDAWLDPRAFIEWALANGWRPGLQIDRENNDGPYDPGNCRFVTSLANNSNRRCTKWLVVKGQRMTWLQVYRAYSTSGVRFAAFCNRLKKGWSLDEALHSPATNLAKRSKGGI